MESRVIGGDRPDASTWLPWNGLVSLLTCSGLLRSRCLRFCLVLVSITYMKVTCKGPAKIRTQSWGFSTISWFLLGLQRDGGGWGSGGGSRASRCSSPLSRPSGLGGVPWAPLPPLMKFWGVRCVLGAVRLPRNTGRMYANVAF